MCVFPLDKEVRCLGFSETIALQARRVPFGPFYGGFVFQAISAVSVLIVSVGILYVLLKLGSFLDAMKAKTEAASTKT
jgi:hypothetical protein